MNINDIDEEPIPPPDWKPSEELLARARRAGKGFKPDLDLGGPREEAEGLRLIAQDEADERQLANASAAFEAIEQAAKESIERLAKTAGDAAIKAIEQATSETIARAQAVVEKTLTKSVEEAAQRIVFRPHEAYEMPTSYHGVLTVGENYSPLPGRYRGDPYASVMVYEPHSTISGSGNEVRFGRVRVVDYSESPFTKKAVQKVLKHTKTKYKPVWPKQKP